MDRSGLTCAIAGRDHTLAGQPDGFPDHRALLDGLPGADARVVADRGALLRAVRPARRGRAVVLGAADDGVLVAGPSGGDARSVAGTWLGPRFEVAFDAAHLAEALTASVGPDVPRPAVVRSADHGSFTTLVMPRARRVALVAETSNR